MITLNQRQGVTKRNIPAFEIAVTGFAVIIITLVILIYQEEKTIDLENSSDLIAENIPDDSTMVEIAPPILRFEESPIVEGAEFFEKSPVIEGQQAYIAFPLEVSHDSPVILVVYSHGSNTHITANMEEVFMQDMRKYGEHFTNRGYAFAASEQHGVNWGNADSVQDIINLINWIKSDYPIAEKVDLIGFSMGGLPTINFAVEYPNLIDKIALLAPTTRSDLSQANIDVLSNIEIKIWHGNKDVNIPLSSTESFVQLAGSYGKSIELIVLEGKAHFDLDTEYMEDICAFFEK